MDKKKVTQNDKDISEIFEGELDKSCLKTIFFYSCIAPIGFGFMGYYLNHNKELQKERTIYKIQK